MINRYKILFGGGIVLAVYLFIALLITSQDSQAQASTWTVQTLKEYVDERFDAVDKAILKADAYTTYRDLKQNEFRGALDDQSRTFARKEDFDNLQKQIDELKKEQEKIENLKAGGSNTLYIIIAVVGFLAAVLALSRNFIASVNKSNRRDEK